MARPTKATKKKEFDVNSLKDKLGLNKSVKEKELSWIPFNQAFHDALGIPGLARGYVTLFRGFSDTGKSTSIYESIAGAQKIGDLPIIIDTEGNFNWEHARNIGMVFEEVADEETGEVINYEGDFMFLSGDDLLEMYKNYDYSDGKEKSKALRGEPVIEDVSHFISDLLDLQDAGELNKNLCFLWDSIGSINSFKSVMSKANNNMWNAGALETAFKSLLNHRIPASRREGKEFTNTFGGVQKIWLDSMGMGQPTIKHKGGEGFKYGSRIIIHMGGKTTSGAQKLTATSGGETYSFGVQTRVEGAKNHVNGIEWKGKICSTPHGFVNPDKLNDYKTEHKDYILGKLNMEYGDFEIEKEVMELDIDDLSS